MTELSRKQTIVADLNQETAKIPFSELQRFFASGLCLQVANSVDLLETVAEIAMDNKAQLEAWMADDTIAAVTDEQATTWLAEDKSVWAVVLAPYVFVQLINTNKA